MKLRCALRLGFKIRLRTLDSGQTPLLVRDQIRERLAAVRALPGRLAVPQLGDLRSQFRLRLDHPPVAHRLVLRRVGLNPSAVERDMIERRKARFQAMLQHLVEQPAEHREKARAVPVRRTEVRRLAARQRLEAQLLAARLRGLPRRMNPEAAGIDDQRRNNRRIIRRTPLGAGVGALDLREVQLGPNKVADEKH